jgi:putative membrane protein insertion efficiency factor
MDRQELGTERGVTDPQSWNYQRILYRPKIACKEVIKHIISLGIPASFVIVVIFCWFAFPTNLIVLLGFCLLFLLIFLKRIVVFTIRLYQAYAPDTVRNSCRFEPSCSQYMIQCIQKYGIWRGSCRGIKRVYRCAHGEGGFDNP